MAFDDRVQFLLLGMAIGFILGYLVRLIRDIKEELDVVKDEIEDALPLQVKDDEGFMRTPIIANIAVFLVVVLAFWASIVSQRASNDVKDSQDKIDNAISCMIESQGAALISLNERSIYTKAITDANIALQKAQAKFFNILLHEPPYSETRRADAVQDYVQALKEFLIFSKRGSTKAEENPFPTSKDLQDCLKNHE